MPLHSSTRIITVENSEDGIPAGGATGQFLAKIDGSNYNVGWVTGGSTEMSPPTISTAGDYTVLVSDYIILKTGITAAGDTVTLPSTADNGQIFTIKDSSGSAATDNITVDTEGAETIDGSETVIINGNYNGITVLFDGTNYSILNSI